MSQLIAFVHPCADRIDLERRVALRQASKLGALTRPLEAVDAIAWGAIVRDISTTGIGLTLCYPFRVGTYLAVDVQEPGGAARTLLTRVVHAQDQPDGTWHVGCEFIKPLADSDLDVTV